MNKFVDKALTGLSIGVGIALALGVFVYFFDNFISSKYQDQKTYVDQTQITSGRGRLTKYGRIPMINTVLTNNFNKVVEEIHIEVGLYDNNGLYGKCHEFTDAFAPNESREILVRCTKFESSNIPEETTFKINIVNAWSRN